MRIGMSASSSLHTDPPQVGARWIAERAAAADAAGLDLFSVGDNHVTSKRYYQNTPTLGWAAAQFQNASIGCLFLLPLWNPVLVAEQVGTLASMSDHPFVLQTGLGQRLQAVGMGQEHSHRGEALEEAIAVLRALFAGEVVSSRFFDFANAHVDLAPSQPVEFWIGSSVPAGIRRAARLGDAWYASSHLTADMAKPLLEIYLDACEAQGSEPRPVLRRDVIVLDDGNEASRVGEAMIESGYRGFPRDAVSVGSVDQVAEEFAAFGELGFTDITCRNMSTDQEIALETIAKLGEIRRQLGV